MGTDVHSRGVLVGSTFILFHFEDALLHGRTYVEVPRASAPGAVHGVAGSRARLGVRSSDIAEPAAASGMLIESFFFFNVEIIFRIAIIALTTPVSISVSMAEIRSRS